jgi:hypothetical protein
MIGMVVAALAATTEAGTNRTKLENLIHRIFDSARLDVEIKDGFRTAGNTARVLSCVPLFVIDEAVERRTEGAGHQATAGRDRAFDLTQNLET